MIKVAYVIGRLDVGGTERLLVDLANALDRSRFTPFVVTLRDAGPLAVELRDVRVIELGGRFKGSARTMTRLWNILQKERPEILHTFLFSENIIGRVVGRLAGVPVVVSGLHGPVSDRVENHSLSPRLWTDHLTFRWCDRVISNSEAYRRFHVRLGFDPRKIVVIRRGKELEKYYCPGERASVRASLGIGDEAVVVLSIARLIPLKGVDHLLAGFAQAVRSAPSLFLLFAGNGNLRSHLEAESDRWGLRDRVRFLGIRSDIPALLAASDTVALCSNFGEGAPNAILEAMAASKPVLATDVGGIHELVADGRTGILVKPRDREAIARGLLALASSPRDRERMGRAGQERIRSDFSHHSFVRRHEQIYLKLLQQQAETL